ncbi:MAG: hypothetical protein HOJ02_06485, partial [Rhodospirillaceae bacterium]|nr:hypothetical protein [Rhodospirillaceae bacterium]
MATKNSEITLPKTIIDEKAADEKSVISSPAPVIKAASKKVAATKIVVKKSAVKKATPKKVAPKKVASKKAASNPVVAKEMSNLPAVFSTAGFDPSLAGIDFTDLTATFEKQYAAAFKLGTAMGAGADLLSKTYADYAQRSFETGLSASQAFLSDGDVTKLATVQTALVEE